MYVTVRPQRGYQEIFGAERFQYLHLGFLSLEAEDRFSGETGQRELVMVLQSGDCEVHTEGFSAPLRRKSVFSEKASAVYLPPGVPFTVHARGSSQLVLASAPAHTGPMPTIIGPDAVRVREVGRENWQREVHDIVSMDFPAERLLVGETYNPPGNWSSYPPHKHDMDRGEEETAMEEAYLFRIDPPHGFGLQCLYSGDGREEVYIVRNLSAVALSGYHPVVAAPGYRLYYLWAMAGRRRKLIPHIEEAHAWILA
ncbi:MAG: 5-deoxy-glucuronate isomerase [Armatimonadota bacterium]|nr:5-deoxy-glucuronate isomerase [Armatimonadota bacterium]